MAEQYNYINHSPIHKGLVVDKVAPGLVKVWIPTANCTVPQGQFKFMHSNTGSALADNELQAALDSAYTCRVATPLTEGSWMKSMAGWGASLFGDDDRDSLYDYRIHGSIKSKNKRGATRIAPKTDNPAKNYVACNYTLGEIGGITLQSIGCMPPGVYPDIEPNQWVLVAFVNSSHYPLVICSLPSDEEWETVLV